MKLVNCVVLIRKMRKLGLSPLPALEQWNVTCTIPAGKAILSPVATNECSYAENPNLKTEAELRACAVSGDEVNSIEATVDGVPVNDIAKYRIQSHYLMQL